MSVTAASSLDRFQRLRERHTQRIVSRPELLNLFVAVLKRAPHILWQDAPQKLEQCSSLTWLKVKRDVQGPRISFETLAFFLVAHRGLSRGPWPS
jgi:hypothetical protein